jgi:short-subunit dehydrogenase
MGLGAEYARQIAARGLNLVLVAWPADGLAEVARALEKRYGIETRCIVIDLADRAGTLSLAETTKDLEIGLVVYNAAQSRVGPFLQPSLSAFHGTALVATYAATKAFNLNLGESLWEEFRPSGVDVLAVCPGATRTPGWEQSHAHIRGSLAPPVMAPAPVVSEALDGLGRRPVVITGRANRLSGFLLNRLLSRRSAVKLLARSMRRMYPDFGKPS